METWWSQGCMKWGLFRIQLMHTCLRSWNEAFTSGASLPVSSSRTVDNSAHQLGTSHFSALHCTHLVDWDMGGSGNIPSSSSSGISDDPSKKEATSALSCGGSPKSESLPSDPVPPKGVSELAGQLAVGWLDKLSWHHLFLLLSSGLWLSLCLCSRPEQALILCSFLISFSRVAAANSTFQCASCTLAKLLSSKPSLSHWDDLPQGGWKSSGVDCPWTSVVPFPP